MRWWVVANSCTLWQCSLLLLGGLAQYMQSLGGKTAKAAPFIVLSILLLISIGGMAALSGSLTTSEWREALRAVDDGDRAAPLSDANA